MYWESSAWEHSENLNEAALNMKYVNWMQRAPFCLSKSRLSTEEDRSWRRKLNAITVLKHAQLWKCSLRQELHEPTLSKLWVKTIFGWKIYFWQELAGEDWNHELFSVVKVKGKEASIIERLWMTGVVSRALMLFLRSFFFPPAL